MIASQSRELMLLDQAERILAEAKTFDEVKEIRDKAEAARTYVKATKLGLELQNRAAEIKLRAERKAGQFLMKLTLHGGDRRSKTHATTLKLEDLGISRDQSRRWQHQASVPEREFQNYLEAVRAEGRELTSAGLLRFAASLRKVRNGKRSVDTPSQPKISPIVEEATEATVHELLAELANHRELLAQMLHPIYEEGENGLKPSERRMISRLLREMRELLEQVRESLPILVCELQPSSNNLYGGKNVSNAIGN